MAIEIVSDTAVPEELNVVDIQTPAEVIAETPVVETAEDLSLIPNQNIVTETIKADPSVYDEALFHTALFYKAIKGLTTGAQDTIAINNSQQGHVAYLLSPAAFASLSGNLATSYPVVAKTLSWAKNSSRVFSKAVAPNVIFALQTKTAAATVGMGSAKTWSATTIAYLVNPAIWADMQYPNVAAPTASFTTAVGGNTTATLATATAGAAIYYTTDGSVPTTSSTLYSAPFSVATTLVIRAVATKSGYTTSTLAYLPYVAP